MTNVVKSVVDFVRDFIFWPLQQWLWPTPVEPHCTCHRHQGKDSS